MPPVRMQHDDGGQVKSNRTQGDNQCPERQVLFSDSARSALNPAPPGETCAMRYLDMDTAKKVSKIGLGTWQFGSRELGYGDSYARSEAKAIVRRALELGVTLFDTAEIYGFGRSERILGEALGDDLESVFLATKILPVMPVAPVVEQRGVASAARLGARKLDLYQVHQPNPAVRDGTIMRRMH